MKNVLLSVSEANQARAAEFCRRHRSFDTTETLDDLAAEFERVRLAALKDAAEWIESVGRHSASRERASVAFELVNVINARSRDA